MTWFVMIGTIIIFYCLNNSELRFVKFYSCIYCCVYSCICSLISCLRDW